MIFDIRSLFPERVRRASIPVSQENSRPFSHMTDHIRYDLLTQQALRGVVRSVLADAAKKGLPGDHHFYISFDTRAEGVRISERLRTQYPEEMTIILQHQFWDLSVGDTAFDIGLSFGGIPEKLTVPFEAINGFFDPSVQFGLQFEEVSEDEAGKSTPTVTQDKTAGKGPRGVSPSQSPALAASGKESDAPAPAPDKPAGNGGEVVRLDRFRKK
jgi:uncharacterized protein